MSLKPPHQQSNLQCISYLVGLGLCSRMSDKTDFENWKQNDSNCLLDNQSLILEFELSDRQIGKKIESTGLELTLFCGISLLILETLGNCLSFCIVWYEKFGMDSKKRTVTNQLLSIMILTLIFFNIFFMPLHFGAFLIPYSEYFEALGSRLWNKYPPSD